MKKRFTAAAILGGGAVLALVGPPSISTPQAAHEAPALPVSLDDARMSPHAGVFFRSESMAESAQLRRTYRQTLVVGTGDTLMAMLVEAGADRRDAHQAITAMSKLFKPRYLKPGHEIEVTLRPAAGPAKADTLISMKLVETVERDIVVRRADDKYTAEAVDHPLTLTVAAAHGEIQDSLFVAGEAAGVPLPVLADLIQIYSFDIDFQRDVRIGDRFSVMYEQFLDDHGEPVRTGNILRASMMVRSEDRPLYRYETTDGLTDYFDDEGKSARRALMRTPINGARLSSNFGMRRHPILGYSKMHTGSDFAAPRGTPIYAAGSGTVEYAGRKGVNGILVKIRHNGTFKTAYAHMNGIARGVRRGSRVQQGQVIGYVGTTGRSTGPHLHYEVHRHGKPINPRTMRLPSGRHLKDQELAQFQVTRDGLAKQFVALIDGSEPQLAVADDSQAVPSCSGPMGPC